MAFAKILFAVHFLTLLSNISTADSSFRRRQAHRAPDFNSENGAGLDFYVDQSMEYEGSAPQSNFRPDQLEHGVPMEDESGDAKSITEKDMEECDISDMSDTTSQTEVANVAQPKEQPTEQVLGCVGHGKFGSVWIIEKGANEFIARKKISLKSLFRCNAVNGVKMETLVSMSVSSHPSFPRFHAFSFNQASAFMDYEVVSGRSLKEFVSEFKPLSTTLIRHFGAQILNAIEYLGEVGLIHCDLNPGNIMLTNEGSVKVIDFGMTVRIGGSHNIDMNESLGVVAPDVHHGQLTTKADIWSWGILMFMMASNGNYPCSPADKHCQHIMWPLIQHRPDLVDIIMMALRHQITQRPTVAMLKNCNLFIGIIDWAKISSQSIPLHEESYSKAVMIRLHLNAPFAMLRTESESAFEQMTAGSSQNMIDAIRVELKRWVEAGAPADF